RQGQGAGGWAGNEDWSSLQAHVWAHRWPPDRFDRENWPEGEPLPKEPVENINLHCWLSIPQGDGTTVENGAIEARTESYGDRPLNVGDEITIRIVEVSAADEPEAPQGPPTIMPT
ncbi:MAG: hypothetical protein AAF417_21670, partial [Pseudomonadota bacterium]